MRYVMKLGPIALERGSACAYVAFGDSGLDVAIEPTDGKGLAALRRRAKGEPLTCEPALSGSAANHGMAVGELPTEVLAMKAALAVNLDHGPSLERVPLPLVLELIASTIEFDEAEPWNAFAPDEAVAIRFEPDGREVEGCVMGQAGEEFGLALYHHKGSIERVKALFAEGRPEAARSLAATTVLIVRDDSYVTRAVDELTGTAVAPLVLHIARGKASAPASRDIAGLIAAMRAVTGLADGGRKATGHTLDAEHRVVAHATRGFGVATQSAFEGVGRNAPCPCGSGKKFKLCHMGSAEATPLASSRAAIHTRGERLVSDILAFGARRFGGDAMSRGVEVLAVT